MPASPAPTARDALLRFAEIVSQLDLDTGTTVTTRLVHDALDALAERAEIAAEAAS